MTRDTGGYVSDIPYLRDFKPMLAPAWLDHAALVCGVEPPARESGFTWCDLGSAKGGGWLRRIRLQLVPFRRHVGELLLQFVRTLLPSDSIGALARSLPMVSHRHADAACNAGCQRIIDGRSRPDEGEGGDRRGGRAPTLAHLERQGENAQRSIDRIRKVMLPSKGNAAIARKACRHASYVTPCMKPIAISGGKCLARQLR